MILLVSGATQYLRSLPDTTAIGHLITPAAGNNVDVLAATGLPIGADNGCYHELDERAFVRMLNRLQLQERLTHQIADEVQRITGSDDVVVVGEGSHLCMEMRGIKTPARMTSSVVRGRFRDLPALRAEAIALMTSR